MPDETTTILRKIHDLERDRRKCNCGTQVAKLDAQLAQLRRRLSVLQNEANLIL